MIISHLTLYHLSMHLRSPFETSFGRSEERECLLIEAFSDGLVGYGECVADREPGYSYETTGTARASAARRRRLGRWADVNSQRTPSSPRVDRRDDDRWGTHVSRKPSDRRSAAM